MTINIMEFHQARYLVHWTLSAGFEAPEIRMRLGGRNWYRVRWDTPAAPAGIGMLYNELSAILNHAMCRCGSLDAIEEVEHGYDRARHVSRSQPLDPPWTTPYFVPCESPTKGITKVCFGIEMLRIMWILTEPVGSRGYHFVHQDPQTGEKSGKVYGYSLHDAIATYASGRTGTLEIEDVDGTVMSVNLDTDNGWWSLVGQHLVPHPLLLPAPLPEQP